MTDAQPGDVLEPPVPAPEVAPDPPLVGAPPAGGLLLPPLVTPPVGAETEPPVALMPPVVAGLPPDVVAPLPPVATGLVPPLTVPPVLDFTPPVAVEPPVETLEPPVPVVSEPPSDSEQEKAKVTTDSASEALTNEWRRVRMVMFITLQRYGVWQSFRTESQTVFVLSEHEPQSELSKQEQ